MARGKAITAHQRGPTPVHDRRVFGVLLSSDARERTLDPERLFQRTALRAMLAQAIGRLPERERAILRRRYGLEPQGRWVGVICRLASIAAEMHMSLQRVAQIEQVALCRLARNNRHLRDFLSCF